MGQQKENFARASSLAKQNFARGLKCYNIKSKYHDWLREAMILPVEWFFWNVRNICIVSNAVTNNHSSWFPLCKFLTLPLHLNRLAICFRDLNYKIFIWQYMVSLYLHFLILLHSVFLKGVMEKVCTLRFCNFKPSFLLYVHIQFNPTFPSPLSTSVRIVFFKEDTFCELLSIKEPKTILQNKETTVQHYR